MPDVTAAGGVLVVGGVSKSGNAVVTKTGTPTTTVDPFSRLVAPTASGTVMSVNLSGNATQTINPGTYSQIKVVGQRQLDAQPRHLRHRRWRHLGHRQRQRDRRRRLIYNAGSNVLGGSGTPSYGGITLSGNGTFNLTAPTSGTYAGILIFQARDNTRAMSISGNASTGITRHDLRPGRAVGHERQRATPKPSLARGGPAPGQRQRVQRADHRRSGGPARG